MVEQVTLPISWHKFISFNYYNTILNLKDVNCSIKNNNVSFYYSIKNNNIFYRFHSLVNIEKKVGLALEVTANLPEDAILKRWLGEPIRCAILPTSLFLTNKKGYPVLSKPHQQLVRKLIKLQCQFTISGAVRHDTVKHYQQYLDFLAKVSKNVFI